MNTSNTDNPDVHANRRTFTRIFFDAETVLSQNENAWSVQLVDISLKGILIQSLEADQIDSQASVFAGIHLGGDLQIRMELRVAHQEGDRVGLHCENIELDSLIHLRRLFELNVADSAMLERELSGLDSHI